MSRPARAWAEFLRLADLETDACVEWTMTLDRDGYGDRIRTPFGRWRVHRLALARRVSGAGFACHTCNNRACLNYRHLYWGNPVTNYADSRAAGTNLRGEAAHSAVLTTSAVRDIRELRDAGRSQQSLADEFGVSQYTISRIVRRLRWVGV